LIRRAVRLGILPLLLMAACTATRPPADRVSGPNAPRNFVVMIEGRNFLFDYEGKPTRFGFSTSRNIVARNPEEAEKIAIRNVREGETLNGALLNPAADPPRITVTHQILVESFESDPSAELGYIFYRDRESK